jgi:hypothetical protein
VLDKLKIYMKALIQETDINVGFFKIQGRSGFASTVLPDGLSPDFRLLPRCGFTTVEDPPGIAVQSDLPPFEFLIILSR